MIEKNSIGANNSIDGNSYFEVNLSVKYKMPVPFKDSSGENLLAIGYFRKFVVIADTEHITRQLLSVEVADGEIDWQNSEIKQMNRFDLTKYSLKDDVTYIKPEVVFRSSHFLYP